MVALKSTLGKLYHTDRWGLFLWDSHIEPAWIYKFPPLIRGASIL